MSSLTVAKSLAVSAFKFIVIVLFVPMLHIKSHHCDYTKQIRYACNHIIEPHITTVKLIVKLI